MLTSIGKYSKSFFVKVLVGIIILPFVFWGMGDVFRGGNQNIIASIDSKKITTQEFMNYINQLNLNKEQIKNISRSNLVEEILSAYIGKKVMNLEVERLGIVVNDTSLKNILKNDKAFLKDNKFSRTEYEKFLLKSGITAPTFEKNIAEQESRRQLLGFLSGGLSISDSLVQTAFKKENQTKTIKYIDLSKFYSNKIPSDNKIKELYENNKGIFIEELKTIKYAKITPEITGSTEYDENFFKKLDEIENKVLDGQSFQESAIENNLKLILLENTKRNKTYKDGKKIENLPNSLFKKFYELKDEKVAQVINDKNEFFLVEITSIKKDNKKLNDPEVQKVIKAQINLQNKIEHNNQIIKDINLGGFDEVKMEEFSKNNNLKINDYKISSLKQNEIFSEEMIKKIFLSEDGTVDLMTNNNLTKNFLVKSLSTTYKNLKKDSNEFEKYKAKAKLDLINKIYKTFDDNLHKKYSVKFNQKTINRVKNSF